MLGFLSYFSLCKSFYRTEQSNSWGKFDYYIHKCATFMNVKVTCVNFEMFLLISAVLYFGILPVLSIISPFHKSTIRHFSCFVVFFFFLTISVSTSPFSFLILFAAHDSTVDPSSPQLRLGPPSPDSPLHLVFTGGLSGWIPGEPPPDLQWSWFIFLPLEWLLSVPRASGGLNLEEC